MTVLVHGAIIAVAAILYVLSSRTEPRRWRNGVFLLVILWSTVDLLASAVVGWLGIDGNERSLVWLALPWLSAVVLGLLLLFNGLDMVRREGRSLGNLLSLLLGVGLIVATVVGVTLVLTGGTTLAIVGIVVLLLPGYPALALVSYLLYCLDYLGRPKRPVPAAIVVLGSGLVDGAIPRLLAWRLDAAIALRRREELAGRRPLLVPSGGQGDDEPTSEGAAMTAYLLERGLDEHDVVTEDRATSTEENLLFSRALLEERGVTGHLRVDHERLPRRARRPHRSTARVGRRRERRPHRVVLRARAPFCASSSPCSPTTRGSTLSDWPCGLRQRLPDVCRDGGLRSRAASPRGRLDLNTGQRAPAPRPVDPGGRMSFVTRGFHGRRRDDDGRLPPGQHLTGDFPVLSAGPTPRIPLDEWELWVATEDGTRHTWSWTELMALAADEPDRRHPLRHELVEARHDVARRLARHAARRRRDGGRLRPGAQLRRLHDEPPARGPARREGLDRLRVRRRRPPPRARRSGAAARAAPLLLEVGQVGARHRADARGHPGLLGAARLPRLRRPMARAAIPGGLSARRAWRPARLVERRVETASATTLVLDVTDWPGHLPGQHVDLRLTADDGYTATRSYSLAAPADGDHVEVTVQRVPDGEVSTFLCDDLQVGDAVELRGPVGGWFVWRPEQPGPVLLVAGGSGVVPLMAMLRARPADGPPFRLVYSAREPDDVIYREELRGAREAGGASTSATSSPAGRPTATPRPAGRLRGRRPRRGRVDRRRRAHLLRLRPDGFRRGRGHRSPAAGHDPARIRTERFGPSGP